MNAKLSQRLAKIVFISVFLVGLDLGSKFLVRQNNVFQTNTGISFGLFPGQINFLIWGLVCIAFAYQAIQDRDRSLWLVTLGGCGNLIDRLVWGAVTDWIHIGVWFNIADVLIVSGAFWFLYNNVYHLNRLRR